MVKTNMVKNIKKRSASQSETIEKKTEISGNFNKNIKKKKTGNETVQNGQTNKNNIANKLKNEQNKNKNKNAAIIQNTNKKQTNDVTSKKRKTQPPTIENKLELLTKRQEYRERRKTNRRIKHGTSLDLSTEDIKEKIQLIEKRDELTKTAKRKLASLRKKLKVEEGTDKPKQDDKIPSKKAKNEKSLEAIKTEKVQNNEQKKKLVQKVENKNKEKDTKQSNSLPLKKKNKDKAADDDKEVDQDDDEVETDDELSEDEDESDVEEEEDENSDDDDDDDDEEEEEDEGKKDKSNKQDKDSNVKKGNIQNLEEKAKPKNAEEESKKKRYVLFVGNLPYSITNEELKKHFLTKVNHIVDIRIPKKDDDTSRGFAYVELSNNTDYEKALSLNHSFVNGRRIKVQYSGNNKKVGVAKNFKLHALQKAGKLASGKNRNNQKYAGNKRKQNMQTTKT